jgi:OOP family OmpA-OmpF porin
MSRLIVGGLIAAACVASGSAAAEGYDDTGAWYLSPLGQYTFLDKDRISDNHAGLQVGLGYNFAPNFALEGALSTGSFGIPNSGAREKLSATSLDMLYKFLPVTSIVRPFVLVGTGGMTDNIGGGQNNTAWLAEAGGGVLIGLGSQTGSTRVQFRTEAKYRYEFMKYTQNIPNDPHDVILGVGFQFMFGAPTPPPPPPPPPPPVVRELPPPPPPPPPPVDGDDDGDGVPNSIDKCPNTPRGDMVDSVGCTITDEIKLEGVNFATDSWTLVPESTYVLDYGVATLKKHPELVIEVHGHTDSRGTEKHNLLLSQRRAESVMAYLKEHGVTNTMTAKGYGKERPIADNATADGRLQNRRVALHIVSGR